MLINSFAGVLLYGAPGVMELLVIAGVFVLLFGATKLPQLGKGVGEGIRNFKEGLKGDPNKADSTPPTEAKELEEGEEKDEEKPEQ